MNFTEHPDFPAAVSLAEHLADAARGIALQHFRTPLAVERKGDGSPVTVADRDIETHMRRMIRAAFPEHAIRGEEFRHGVSFVRIVDCAVAGWSSGARRDRGTGARRALGGL